MPPSPIGSKSAAADGQRLSLCVSSVLPAPRTGVTDPEELYQEVCRDIAALLETEIAMDNHIPGTLEHAGANISMNRLWDKATWAQHRAQARWIRYLRGWPRSTVLKAIRFPLVMLLGFAMCVLALNRVVAFFLSESQFPLLRLPQTPLALQSASIGLILVFRTNQTHDRLREAQKEMGRLSAVEREILQMLLVHVPVQQTHVICLVARLLAYFGWILKAELWDDDMQKAREFSAVILPEEEREWIFKQEIATYAVIFRMRTLVGALYNQGLLDKEAFKFVEEDFAKLGDIRSVCERLTTFPIPPSYHRHGSRAILLWLGALPFALEGKGHKAIENLVTVVITGFVVLGLDAIAIETEQPFDVMPLYQFASNMARDVRAGLQGWLAMPGRGSNPASSTSPSAMKSSGGGATAAGAGEGELRFRGGPSSGADSGT